MSYYLCKRIILNEKKNIIKVCVASNNVYPKTYRVCELCDEKNYTFDEKLLHLFYDLQSGNIQISSINDNTEKFEYAMCKVKEYLIENNIDSYNDLYKEKNRIYEDLIYNWANIERVADENLDKSEKEYQIHKKYQIWVESQNKEDVKKMENKLYKQALYEVYGKSFEVFKKALNEKNDEDYKLMYNGSPIVKLGKYDRGYSKFFIGSSQILKMNYKKAYIVKDNFKNMKLDMIKIEG